VVPVNQKASFFNRFIGPVDDYGNDRNLCFQRNAESAGFERLNGSIFRTGSFGENHHRAAFTDRLLTSLHHLVDTAFLSPLQRDVPVHRHAPSDKRSPEQRFLGNPFKVRHELIDDQNVGA